MLNFKLYWRIKWRQREKLLNKKEFMTLQQRVVQLPASQDRDEGVEEDLGGGTSSFGLYALIMGLVVGLAGALWFFRRSKPVHTVGTKRTVQLLQMRPRYERTALKGHGHNTSSTCIAKGSIK